MELEKDQSGNVLTKPIIGWTTATLADISVLLVIQYTETPQEIETGGKSIQFVLMPQACLDLAETLTRQAKRLLQDRPGNKPVN